MTTPQATAVSLRVKPMPSVEGVLTWMDLMETCEQLLLAGLRHSIGPDGDLDAAYRDWNARQADMDDRRLARMLGRPRAERSGDAD